MVLKIARIPFLKRKFLALFSIPYGGVGRRMGRSRKRWGEREGDKMGEKSCTGLTTRLSAWPEMSFLLSLFIFLSSQQGKKKSLLFPPFDLSLASTVLRLSLFPLFKVLDIAKVLPLPEMRKKDSQLRPFANLSMTVEIIFFVGQDIFSAPREWEIFLEKKRKKIGVFFNFFFWTQSYAHCTVFCSITTLFLVFTLIRNYPCKGEIISRVGIFFR